MLSLNIIKDSQDDKPVNTGSKGITLNIITEDISQSWSVARVAAVPILTWESVFEAASEEIREVSEVLEQDERCNGQFYPLKRELFAAFNHTPLNTVKVVIVGQDPYPQTISLGNNAVPRAMGLSFSVRLEDTIPSSLKNIYIELANTVRGFTIPDHGNLLQWAHQGVLLVNACLTLRPGVPGSHDEIWLGFMKRIFARIAEVNPFCIYMLWGKESQKLKPLLGERSVILEAAHPSGMSARRGFFGCNHFNLANDALLRQGKNGIDWHISSRDELIQKQHGVSTGYTFGG